MLYFSVYLRPAQQTIPTENRDYPEWHHTREKYALWYLELHQPELLAYLNQIKMHFQEYLFVPNQRQFHITVFICGFLNHQIQFNDDFLMADLQQHVDVLKQAKLPKLRLKVGGINSFSSALFVEIEDQNNQLGQIRQHLQLKNNEIAALHYCPHITLGLYQQAIPSELILQKIRNFPQQSFELELDHLTFGYYHATELQGLLYPHTQLQLESSIL